MKGYTLIELLIVVGVLAILTGLSALSMVSFSKSSDIETSATIVKGALSEARAGSMADIDDKTWGVYLEPNRAILFADSGSGYNPSDPSNSVRIISNQTSLSWGLAGGGNIIEFSKRTGKTAEGGTITCSGESVNTKTLNINSEGLIE